MNSSSPSSNIVGLDNLFLIQICLCLINSDSPQSLMNKLIKKIGGHIPYGL